MRAAVITGASSGLGSAFAKRLAQDNEADEIWVIARREDRLNALRSELGERIVPLALDLTDETALETLKAKLEETKPVITWMICAAGLGRAGNIADLSAKDNAQMIAVNVKALVDVTTLCLPYLHAGSKVIEIASVAAFQPMPHFAMYGATKAFVQSYAKALHYELNDRGIHVTCLCPYWISDTEFIQGAVKQDAGYYLQRPLSLDTPTVIDTAVKDVYANRWISTPGIVSKIDRIAAKLLPHALVIRMMDQVSRL
jgi:hypothetical protein